MKFHCADELETDLWNGSLDACSTPVWDKSWGFMLDTVWEQISIEVWGVLCDAMPYPKERK